MESNENNDAIKNPEQMRGPMVVCICGPRAAGKDTILAALLKEFKDMRKMVAFTTRAPRIERDGKQEKDGDAYHFVTKETMEDMERRGDLLLKTSVGPNFYAFAKTSIPTSGLYVTQTEPKYARTIKEEVTRRGGRTLLVSILAPERIRKPRIQKRQDISDDEVRQMMVNDVQGEGLEEYQDFDVIARNHGNETSQPVRQVIDAINKFIGKKPDS